jgi:hypothetical protein
MSLFHNKLSNTFLFQMFPNIQIMTFQAHAITITYEIKCQKFQT